MNMILLILLVLVGMAVFSYFLMITAPFMDNEGHIIDEDDEQIHNT